MEERVFRRQRLAGRGGGESDWLSAHRCSFLRFASLPFKGLEEDVRRRPPPTPPPRLRDADWREEKQRESSGCGCAEGTETPSSSRKIHFHLLSSLGKSRDPRLPKPRLLLSVSKLFISLS